MLAVDDGGSPRYCPGFAWVKRPACYFPTCDPVITSISDCAPRTPRSCRCPRSDGPSVAAGARAGDRTDNGRTWATSWLVLGDGSHHRTVYTSRAVPCEDRA